MRRDLPTPLRTELDAERKTLCRAVGATYERLVEAHIDPAPFVAAVMHMLAEAESEAGQRAA